MKQYFKTVSNFFSIKNKKAKIASYVASGLFVIYVGILIYPNFLFGHSLTYKNFTVYSTQPLTNNMQTIIDETELKLAASEIYDKGISHTIYLCNNYNLYAFLAPAAPKAFACNYPLINNIFIANCNIEKNEAYKNNAEDNYTRQLSALIAHETTHTLIEKKIGFWKFYTLSGWKNEGYCEYVCNGQNNNLKQAQTFLIENKNDTKPGTYYHKYYIAVNYLMTTKKMTFDTIVSTKFLFDDVLNKVELAP